MYYFLIPVGMFYIFFWDFIFLKSLCWIFGKWDDTAQNLAKKGNHKRYSCICSNRTRYVNILINIHHSQDKLGTILPRLSILNFFSIFKKISLALYQINFILSHWTNGNYWSRAENCESFKRNCGSCLLVCKELQKLTWFSNICSWDSFHISSSTAAWYSAVSRGCSGLTDFPETLGGRAGDPITGCWTHISQPINNQGCLIYLYEYTTTKYFLPTKA